MPDCWRYALLGLAAGASMAAAEPVRSVPTREQAAIVVGWLRVRPAWRLATKGDCGDCLPAAPPPESFPPRTPDPPRNPFYVSADLDGDSREDLAVIVVGRRDASRRLVLVFNGGPAPALVWPTVPAVVLGLWQPPGAHSEAVRAYRLRVALGPLEGEPGQYIVWHKDRFIVRRTGW